MVLLLVLSLIPPVSLVPSKIWDLWLYHNTGIFQIFFGVFFNYFHPIIQLVISLIASDLFFHRCFVSRGMVNPVVFWFFCVGRDVVLSICILAFKVVPCFFHSLTLVLYQCKTFLPIMWLLCIYLIVML